MIHDKLTILLLLFSITTFSQQQNSSEFIVSRTAGQTASGEPHSSRAWMDSLKYPSGEYGASFVYLLVKPYYLSDTEAKTLMANLKVPANSSNQVKVELDYLLDLQAKRTPEQVERVTFLGNIGYWPSINQIPSHPSFEQNLEDLFFEGREVLGSQANARNFPKTSRLLQGVMQDMRVMEFTIKYKFYRPRPYHLEPKLQPLMKINSPSFVSGHTLWAFLQGFLWSKLVPGKQTEFIALAEEIQHSREIMGIHYPSDNEGSREVASAMMKYYFSNKAFLKDYDEAVAEWKAQSSKYVR